MIYTELGYIEIEDSDLKNLSVLFGGRGLGKTYSVLKHRIENSLNDPNQKFIWMRDSQEVVKKIAAGNSLASPICQNEPKLPNITIEGINGNYCFVADFCLALRRSGCAFAFARGSVFRFDFVI